MAKTKVNNEAKSEQQDIIQDQIEVFIEGIESAEDHDRYFSTLPDVLEVSHLEFLEEKNKFSDNFNKDIMIPRIKLFNILQTEIEKAKLSQNDKQKYSRYVKMYSVSTDEKVFEKVKNINAKKETQSFWIKSFNTSVIYKLNKDLNDHIQATKIMQTNLQDDISRVLERATTSKPEKETPTDNVKKSKKDETINEDGEKGEDTTEETNSNEKTLLSYKNKESFNKLSNLYKDLEKAFDSYYEFHKRFYLNRVFIQRNYVNTISNWIDQLGSEKSDIYDYYKQFMRDIQHIDEKISQITANALTYIDSISRQIHDAEPKLSIIKASLTDDEQKKLDIKSSLMRNAQLNTLNKINGLYNNTSPMAVILDNQFTYMYILKVITYGLHYLSLFFAEKIFSDMYTKIVYVQNKDPPNLLTFYGIFLGFALANVMFLIVVMYVISLIFNKPLDGSIAINNDLIIKYLVDMAIFHIITGALLCVIGSLIQRKKYFMYKNQGPRAIRAYSEAISIVSAITIIIPYFLFV